MRLLFTPSAMSVVKPVCFLLMTCLSPWPLPRTVSADAPTPREVQPVLSWSEMIRAAGETNPSAMREAIIASARETATNPIVKRVYTYEDIGRHRTRLDGRARALAGTPRQAWFALAISDFTAGMTVNEELPLLALAFRFTGDETFKTRIVSQLEETATWSPLQRPGWTLYAPSPKPVPPDFNDGNWLATGVGVRALADTLEILPPGSLPEPLVRKIHALLTREIHGVADDWKTRRPWFVKFNVPRSNQWVLPTEGLVRACLVLGKDKHPDAYALGVKNLLAALNAQGAQGEFYEGLRYANMTVMSMIHTAHAMAVEGDRRALDHPYFRRFPVWMVQHLQPGRFRINCFDAGGDPRVPPTDRVFRQLLSLFVALADDPVARWALTRQFSGPSDDYIGLLASAHLAGEIRDPGLFASYEGATRVNWRSSWDDDATGVWVRGGHPLDTHDHFDRGHVNFIACGKPVLIEAGTPAYDNPRIRTHYQSRLGHNVLDIVGGTALKKPAPIEVRRLESSGGEVVLEPTAGYPGLRRWRRTTTWTAERLDVRDEVSFPETKPGSPLFRWHLGTRDDVIVQASASNATATWEDAEISLDSSLPLSVTVETMPDNTVTLGEKEGPDHVHRCLIVRPLAPCTEWTLKTAVTAP